MAIPIMNFEIININSALMEKTIAFFKENFLRYENVCIATNILSCEEATNEMIIWLAELLKHGISFAARNIETKEIIGICINKVMNPTSNAFFKQLFAQFDTPALKFIESYTHCMNSTFDIFKEWNIYCGVEIAFLSTRPDYSQRGIATELVKLTIDFAKQVLENRSTLCDTLPIEIRTLRPRVICSIFSSYYTQRLGEKLGFQTLYEVSNSDILVYDKSLAINPKHEFTTFAALRL